jgi:ABC-type Fe3+-siderophore transport system permease subunit
MTVAAFLGALVVFAAIYLVLRRRAGGAAPGSTGWVVAIVALAALAVLIGLLS